MKCDHCGSEFNPAAGLKVDIKKCPFCGAAFEVKTESVKDALRWAVKTYGIDIFRNDTKLNSLLADLTPDEVKNRKKISQALFVGVGSLFYQILIENNGKVGEEDIASFRRRLEEDDFTPAFSLFIINSFLYSVSLPEVSDDSSANVSTHSAGENETRVKKISYQKSDETDIKMSRPARVLSNKELDIVESYLFLDYAALGSEICPCGSQKMMKDCHMHKYSNFTDDELSDELIPLAGVFFYPERYPDDIREILDFWQFYDPSDINIMSRGEKILFIALLSRSLKSIRKGDACPCSSGADFCDCHGFVYRYKTEEDIDRALVPPEEVLYQYKSIADWYVNNRSYAEVFSASKDQKIRFIAGLDRGRGEICMCGSGKQFKNCHLQKLAKWTDSEIDQSLDLPAIFEDDVRELFPSWFRKWDSVSELRSLKRRMKIRVRATIDGVLASENE